MPRAETVAESVVAGAKLARSVVDFTAAGDPSAVTVEQVNALGRWQNFINRLGYAQLLKLQP